MSQNLRREELEEQIKELKAQNQHLTTEVSRFKSVQKATNDGVWDWDLKTNVIYYSDRYYEMLGYWPNEFPPKIDEFFGRLHPADFEEVEKTLTPCLDGNASLFVSTFRMKHKEGHWVWINGRGVNQKDDTGNVIRIIGAYTDINRQVKADHLIKQERQTFEELFQKSPTSLCILESDKHTDCNQATLDMFGYDDREEFLSLTLVELSAHTQVNDTQVNDTPAKEAIDRIITKAFETGPQLFDWLHVRKNGEVFPTEVRLSVVSIANRQVILTTIFDITKRKKIEDTLREAKVAAEDAARSKTDFLANVSHEIRTPMNAIIGMSYLLNQTEMTPRQADYHKSISSAATSLLHIINDILDFSKIETGKLVIEETDCNIRQIIDNISSFHLKKISKKDIVFTTSVSRDIPETLTGDPTRIGQVLNNLLNNAIKFTEKGKIDISIELLESTSDSVTIQYCVTDTGEGMDEKKLSDIFQKFSQGDSSSTRQHGGTGIGLAISQQLVGLMRGEIWVESEVNKGSKFFFTIPLSNRASGKSKERLPLPLNLRNLKVMVIEENKEIQKYLASRLTSLTFKVDSYNNHNEAILKLQQAVSKRKPYELIVIDCATLEEAQQFFRNTFDASEQLRDLPTIITSEEINKSKAQVIIDNRGFTEIISKEITAENLFNAIVRVFGYSDLEIDHNMSSNIELHHHSSTDNTVNKQSQNNTEAIGNDTELTPSQNITADIDKLQSMLERSDMDAELLVQKISLDLNKISAGISNKIETYIESYNFEGALTALNKIKHLAPQDTIRVLDIKAELEEIHQALEISDLEAIYLVEKLEEELNKISKTDTKKLQNNIEAYEFEAARATLSQICYQYNFIQGKAQADKQ
ncbi:MAG: ATP-binding protein [Desulfotalea sp.]